MVDAGGSHCYGRSAWRVQFLSSPGGASLARRLCLAVGVVRASGPGNSWHRDLDDYRRGPGALWCATRVPQASAIRSKTLQIAEFLRYLMNSISEYFGSGQRSSATIRSSRSATVADAVHRRDHACRACTSAQLDGVVLGWFSAGVGRPRASSDRGRQLVDQRARSRRSASATPAALSSAQVAHRRRQEHRPRDRRRRLGLDVELDRVLLDEDLVARLELALGEHVVVARTPSTVCSSISHGSASGVVRRFVQPALLGLRVPLLGVVVAVEDDPLVGRRSVLDDRRRPPPRARAAGLERVLELARPARRSPRRRSCSAPCSGSASDMLEPSARNSNLLPVKANGEVRLRSPPCIGSGGSTGVPRPRIAPGLARVALAASRSRRRPCSSSAPRKIEMIAGGASLAPRRWSWPTLATDARSSAWCLLTAWMTAAQKNRNCRFSCGVSPGLEQVRARVGAHRPVVVLARAVDAGERLLVQQADEAVAAGDVLQHLHRQLLVVGADVGVLEDRRDLVLGRRDLVVARLDRHAELRAARARISSMQARMRSGIEPK